jgi:dienelactone hydrolase
MARLIDRGSVVLAPDLYTNNGTRRPFIIISNEDYPFYPSGYLGIPITSQNKPNTFEISDYDIAEVQEPLEVTPSYANPFSPSQVNNAGRTLVKLSDGFLDLLTDQIQKTTCE